MRKRKKYLSIVINSNIVNNSTDVITAIEISEQIARYIETGEVTPSKYPYGYVLEERPER